MDPQWEKVSLKKIMTIHEAVFVRRIYNETWQNNDWREMNLDQCY